MITSKYLKEFKNKLNSVSPTFCSAKWYHCTIWLDTGKTASCHHPLAHEILIADIKNKSCGLHNTKYKKTQQQLMLDGVRPDECSYCWRIEDLGEDVISDRVIKSLMILDKDTFDIKDTSNVDPKILEITFDNVCNLYCSYCNKDFSSTWENDIKKNGSYKNLKTTSALTWSDNFNDTKNSNLYIQAFNDWFSTSLRNNLLELRITGGEPTKSQHFWKFLDKCKNEKFALSVNSNLMLSKKYLHKLISNSYDFKNFNLFTSCEAYGKHAEFIRAGFKYNKWLNNLRLFASLGSYENITIMMTINALCLNSITKFLDEMVALKKEYNNKSLFRLSLNILRFPNFQSINILPKYLKEEYANKLQVWVNNNIDEIEELELANIKRLILYLHKVYKGYEDIDTYKDKLNDFKIFYTQYGDRRNMLIKKYFEDSNNFINWYDSI